MLPEIVTEKDAKIYEQAMKSPQGVFFVTNENENNAVLEQRKRHEQMNEQLEKVDANGDSSGISGPEQTVGESV